MESSRCCNARALSRKANHANLLGYKEATKITPEQVDVIEQSDIKISMTEPPEDEDNARGFKPEVKEIKFRPKYVDNFCLLRKLIQKVSGSLRASNIYSLLLEYPTEKKGS